jgi:CheY-like chemotaxis protein
MSGTRALPTVLYVDDERSNRLIFRYSMAEWVRIRLAESAAEALEILEREPVEILLADLRMPEVNGAALARIVRERFPTLPIFIVTGYPDDPELRELTRSAAVKDVFVKPWIPEELRDAFAKVLGMPASLVR